MSPSHLYRCKKPPAHFNQPPEHFKEAPDQLKHPPDAFKTTPDAFKVAPEHFNEPPEHFTEAPEHCKTSPAQKKDRLERETATSARQKLHFGELASEAGKWCPPRNNLPGAGKNMSTNRWLKHSDNQMAKHQPICFAESVLPRAKR